MLSEIVELSGIYTLHHEYWIPQAEGVVLFFLASVAAVMRGSPRPPLTMLRKPQKVLDQRSEKSTWRYRIYSCNVSKENTHAVDMYRFLSSFIGSKS